MALVSQTELEARLGRSLTAKEASAFTTINSAVQLYIEKKIGSSVEEVSASSRYYDGSVQNLSIDPCYDITAVKYVDNMSNEEYTFEDKDYTAEPINETIKYWLRNRYGKFNASFNNITVTAKFSTYGDSGITAIVKDAILGYLEGEINDTSNIAKESIEGYSVEFASKQSKNALMKLDYLFGEV